MFDLGINKTPLMVLVCGEFCGTHINTQSFGQLDALRIVAVFVYSNTGIRSKPHVYTQSSHRQTLLVLLVVCPSAKSSKTLQVVELYVNTHNSMHNIYV